MSFLTRRSSFIALAIAAGTVSALTACSKSSTAPLTAGVVAEVSGDSQTVTVGTPGANLVVRVFSSSGAIVPGATVTWAVAQGSGALSATTSVTDSAGAAAVAFTPSAAGTDVVAATVATVTTPVDFTITANPVPDSTTAGGN